MSTDITISLDAVRSEVLKFDNIEAGMADLEARYPKDVVCEVATTAGMDQAVEARRAWRDPRIAVEKARKAAKAPVLELGRRIDSFAASLEERLRLGEDAYDSQIKAEEARKEAIRQQRLQEEAARIAAIRRRIVEVFSVPPSAPGVRISAAMLREIRGHLENEPVDDSFGDLKIEAQETKCAMLEMLGVKIGEQEALESAQAEIDRQRAAFAEEQRVETARRAAEREAENRRLSAVAEEALANVAREAERLAAQREENARQQAQIDAQRAELDRREAEAAEAARVRQAAADAEENARVDAEQRERARQRMAEDAALARLHAAAEPMWKLLDDWRSFDLEAVNGPCKVLLNALRERRDRILSDLRVSDAQGEERANG
jgi:hypothetical protein